MEAQSVSLLNEPTYLRNLLWAPNTQMRETLPGLFD